MATTSGEVGRSPVGELPGGARVSPAEYRAPRAAGPGRAGRDRGRCRPATESAAGAVVRSLDDFCARVHFQFISIRLVGLSRLLGRPDAGNPVLIRRRRQSRPAASRARPPSVVAPPGRPVVFGRCHRRAAIVVRQPFDVGGRRCRYMYSERTDCRLGQQQPL